jgi:N-acetylglucosamine-6-sulfatase
VLQALDERKLANNTVVIYLSDNGYMMGSRGLDGKVVPYEESIRVPLLVRWPGMHGFAGRSDAQVCSLDVSATILAAAGIRPPDDWPGRNLAPALRDRAAPGFDASFAEYCDNEPERPAQFRMVRTRARKLIRWEREDKADELYDLENDAHETKNLIADPAEAENLADLTGRLEAWMEKTGDYALKWPRKKKAAA